MNTNRWKPLRNAGHENEELKKPVNGGIPASELNVMRECQFRLLVQSVIVVHFHFPLRCSNRDHSKYAHVGCRIHQYVVHQCGHAVNAAANQFQHDVTRLRDGRGKP